MLADLLALATEQLRVGDWASAIRLCDGILESDPESRDALRLRYAALTGATRHAEALAVAVRLCELEPTNAEHANHLGNALQALGRYEDAVASYDLALQLAPTLVAALNNRGTSLRALGRSYEALASFERAIEIRPDYARAWANRGTVLKDTQRPDEAVQSYERALAGDAGNPLTWSNLSAALCELRQHEAALAAANHALSLRPSLVEAVVNRAAVLMALKRFHAALEDYLHAMTVARAPAVRARALEGAYGVYVQLKQYEQAAAALAEALALSPELEFGAGNLLEAKLQLCDWQDYDRHIAAITASVSAGAATMRPLEFIAISDSPGLQRRCAEVYAAKTTPPVFAQPAFSQRPPGPRIRIAYVSPDFRDHAVAVLLAGVISAHDRERFEIFAFSLREEPDSPMARRLRGSFEHFIDVSRLSDAQVAAVIAQHDIDIAVDLMGYTDRVTTVFARRAAPVQVNYLGYPGTLGDSYHDYILADATVIPPGDAGHYSEHVVTLPHTYLPADDTRVVADESLGREAAGLPASGVVFAAFNRHGKITPAVFGCWMRVLRRVAGSVLWLSPGTEASRAHLRACAQAAGVESSRLVFAARTPNPETHLGRHRLADLLLDTTPFNGHTTTSDALWAGLPVLTCAGASFASRVAASVLVAAELPELVASSLEDYEQRAVDLAGDPLRLQALRARVAAARIASPAFDTRRYTRHLEAALATMHARRRAGLPAAAIRIAT